MGTPQDRCREMHQSPLQILGDGGGGGGVDGGG